MKKVIVLSKEEIQRLVDDNIVIMTDRKTSEQTYIMSKEKFDKIMEEE